MEDFWKALLTGLEDDSGSSSIFAALIALITACALLLHILAGIL